MADEERPVDEEENPTEQEDIQEEENEIIRLIRAKFPDAILSAEDGVVQISRDSTYKVLKLFRDEPSLLFNYLVDITAVDRLYLDEDIRYFGCVSALFTQTSTTVLCENSCA